MTAVRWRVRTALVPPLLRPQSAPDRMHWSPRHSPQRAVSIEAPCCHRHRCCCFPHISDPATAALTDLRKFLRADQQHRLKRLELQDFRLQQADRDAVDLDHPVAPLHKRNRGRRLLPPEGLHALNRRHIFVGCKVLEMEDNEGRSRLGLCGSSHSPRFFGISVFRYRLLVDSRLSSRVSRKNRGHCTSQFSVFAATTNNHVHL